MNSSSSSVLGPQMAAAMLSDFRTLRKVRLQLRTGSIALTEKCCFGGMASLCKTDVVLHGHKVASACAGLANSSLLAN